MALAYQVDSWMLKVRPSDRFGESVILLHIGDGCGCCYMLLEHRHCTIVNGMYNNLRRRGPMEFEDEGWCIGEARCKRPTSALDLRPAPPRLNRSHSELHQANQRLLLPFNLPKDSAKMQKVASPTGNGGGTLSAVTVMLVSLAVNMACGQQ